MFAPNVYLDAFSILEHGNGDEAGEGPDQRLNRKLTEDEVATIRELAAKLPAYRIWNTLFRDICSYHTVRRVANRELYKEQP